MINNDNGYLTQRIVSKGMPFLIDCVTIDDVIAGMNFPNEMQRDVLYDMIDFVEKTTAEQLVEEKCVFITNVGRIRKTRGQIARDKFVQDIQEAKKSMSKLEYNMYMKSMYTNMIIAEREEQRHHKFEISINRKYLKQYETYKRTIGKAYADLFLFSMKNFETVEFDQELEDAYYRYRHGNL